MNRIIKTKRFLKKVSVEVLSNGIHIVKSSPFESIGFDVSFEQMKHQIR